MVIPKKRLSSQCGGVERPCQAPQGKALAEGMWAPRQRGVHRHPLKSESFGYAPHLCHPEPGGQRGLAAKRPYMSPSGLILDVEGQRLKRMQDLVAHEGSPAEIGSLHRVARKVLVPEMQSSDHFAHLNSRTVGQRDGSARRAQPDPQNAAWIVSKFVDTVTGPNHRVEPAHGHCPQFVRPFGGCTTRRGYDIYCRSSSLSCHATTTKQGLLS